MVFLTSFEEKGLVVLPTHRVLNSELETDLTQEELIETLQEHFQVKPFKVDLSNPQSGENKINQELKKVKKKENQIGIVMVLPRGNGYSLQLKSRVNINDMIDDNIHPSIKKLDVTILHKFIINQVWLGNPEIDLEGEDIFFERETKRIFQLLQNRKGCAAFFIEPLSAKKIQEIASLEELLPPKTTYFYPKIITGLVMRDLQTS
jgi:uncharacterized protein (DUF1015 family)